METPRPEVTQLRLPFDRPKQSPGGDTSRRPFPPPGYVLHKWRNAGGSRVCAECGHTDGFAWMSGGWQDPRAQKAFDDGEKKGIILGGAGDEKITCDQTPILMHWSRFGEGTCISCDLKYWHDFGGSKNSDWHYYYLPRSGHGKPRR